MKKIKANREAAVLVKKREEFQGNSLSGEAYLVGNAPWAMSGTWLSQHEVGQYEKVRDRVTYIVWSFYTPIAYYVEYAETDERAGGGHWYKVGQTFSSFTSRHRNHALNQIGGHLVLLTGDRGDWTVECLEPECWGKRHFTRRDEAQSVYYLHRS